MKRKYTPVQKRIIRSYYKRKKKEAKANARKQLIAKQRLTSWPMRPIP